MEYNMNQSPVASGGQMPLSPEPPKSGIGPIAGAIVVILLLVAGGLYFWGATLNEEVMNNSIPYIPSDEVPAGGDSDSASGLPPQSSSDDAAAIETDLETMNFDQFEAQTEADVGNFDAETQ